MNVAQHPPEIAVLSDPVALAEEAARRFAEAAAEAIATNGTGTFRVALSGGSTPRAMYEKLVADPWRDQIDWSRVHVFFSDERFVPLGSSDSNFHTARESLLSHVPIPDRFVHPYATVDITPRESASNYEEGIRRVFQVGLTEVPRFDAILLGLGPDGHTASLFPGTDALRDTDDLVAANFVPKLDMWRLTFTYPLINAGLSVMFLVQGEDKADRVQEVMGGDSRLPAAGVRPVNGRLVWLLDRAAAGRLPSPDSAQNPGRQT